jgi:hypothetical protein
MFLNTTWKYVSFIMEGVAKRFGQCLSAYHIDSKTRNHTNYNHDAKRDSPKLNNKVTSWPMHATFKEQQP